MKTCTYCGNPNAHGNNSTTIGKCPEHLKIWEEDIAFGLHKRNRLRDILIARDAVANQLKSQTVKSI